MNIMTTKKARDKFAKAHGGASILPTIAQIAFGDGGHDVLGNPIDVSDEWINLPGEFIRKDIDATEYPADMVVRIVGTLAFEEGVGKEISVVGLYDSDGDLVNAKTFQPIPKGDDTSIEVIWDEQF